MTIRFLLSVTLFTTVTTTGFRAEEPKPVKPDEITELGEQMDQLSMAFRKLRRQAGDAAGNESSLGYVATMRKGAEAALALTPAKAAEVPDAERAKFVAAYQEQMKKLIAALTELEVAFKAGKNAEALKLVNDLGALQKASHKDFRKPDKH